MVLLDKLPRLNSQIQFVYSFYTCTILGTFWKSCILPTGHGLVQPLGRFPVWLMSGDSKCAQTSYSLLLACTFRAMLGCYLILSIQYSTLTAVTALSFELCCSIKPPRLLPDVCECKSCRQPPDLWSMDERTRQEAFLQTVSTGYVWHVKPYNMGPIQSVVPSVGRH